MQSRASERNPKNKPRLDLSTLPIQVSHDAVMVGGDHHQPKLPPIEQVFKPQLPPIERAFQGPPEANNGFLIGEAIAEFIDDCKFRGCSAMTTKNYRKFLTRTLSEHTFVPTDHKVIRKCLSKFTRVTTRRTYWLYFSAFYSYMEKEHGLLNPMLKVTKPDEKDERLPDYLTPDEKRQLLEADLIFRDKVIIKLFAETGVRPGEIAAEHGHPLRFCDIYQDCIKVWGKKGERIIPITAETEAALLSLQNGRAIDSPVIIRNDGNPITTWGLRKVVRRAFRVAGIKGHKPCPYTLRHSFGGDFLAEGGDVAMLQRILGHRDIKTTMVYTHIADKALINAYRRYVPGANNQQLFAPAEATELLPQLLDQLEALGQTAHQLKEALGSNGQRAEKLAEIRKLLEHQVNK